MGSWWVNHKKTFAEEISGGFIWSPRQKSNGAKNPTYDHLTQTKVGDLIFSYASGVVKAVGRVAHECVEAPRPETFGTIGNQWAEHGYLVKVVWTLLDVDLRPKQHLELIRPLLPTIHSPIKPSGDGNQNCYLAAIGSQLADLLHSLCDAKNPVLNDQLDETHSTVVALSIQNSDRPATMKDRLIKARVGQGYFRNELQKVESKCRLTHVNDERFLVASHIKPWRVSSDDERLDGNNGLLLAPHVDRLFDQGWLSFADDGTTLIASDAIRDVLDAWQVDYLANVGSFNEAQRSYLAHHRNHVFKKGNSSS